MMREHYYRFLSKNLVINIDNVEVYGVTDDNIMVKYIEATTGIATPTQKKVILG